MLLSRFIAGMFLVSLMVLRASVASGQNFPSKSIRFVASSAGSTSDLVMRLVAPALGGNLGQPVIIDNRSSILQTEIVSKAPPDGYTLLVGGGTLWIAPLLQDMLFDPVKDFLSVTMLVTAPNILVVHPSLPVKSVKELIALAKSRPGELNYASSSVGGSPHLSAELFKTMAGVNLVHIPYKGTAPALNDLLGGQVQVMFPSPGGAVPHIKSGRLLALAVTSAKPSALFPELPTVAASGLPGYESGSIYGVFAPARTSATIINRLNQEIVRVLNRADVKEKLFTYEVEAAGGSPEQFTAFIKSDLARWGKLIKDAGIKTY